MIEQLRIPIANLEIAAWRGGTRGATPLLALHGWLDNAASFLPLLPWLSRFDVVAIDLPGHGFSQHRPQGAWYHFIDNLGDVLAVADALGWTQFQLLGHSLGGAIASLLAAAVPDRVEAMWLIESLGPISTDESRLPALLGEAIADRARAGQKQLRRFNDLSIAVAARRSNPQMPLSEHTARLLVERGTRQEDGAWIWSSDPRLTLTSAIRLSEAQILAYLAAIRCTTRLVLAEPAMPFLPRGLIDARLAAVPGLTLARLPGSHHLHMESPEAVAELLFSAQQ